MATYYGDVFGKPLDQELNNGAASVGYGHHAHSLKTIDAQEKENPDPSGVAMKYDGRFDDPDYYGQ